ncbi:alpha-mannosidase [Paenibacillus sp. FSL H7-0716]|uniref:Alpha-mannosidase n=1 Tax=Paenibacillus odorifer TaxID=189426 RepID=A0A1R0Y814_9BACL|nr:MULTISPECIES: alpha-mannosidase [Paenibacillus]AIQ37165.1 alpha-mannosidase [Paenibacillus sp. FSL R5-0345]OMD43490.1 alpha-mannosidase [Paenibacillus odorifer]OME16624.1 alpha-mannosidase [Paenibacillus odorifer]
MFYTLEKLQLRINELSAYRYREAIRLEEWLFQVDEEKAGGVRCVPDLQGNTKVNTGDRWKGRDVYVWLSQKISIPAEWKERRIVGIFDFGKTGGGNNSGFESLLYLEGEPFQGVDSNHQEVFLPAEYTGREVALDFRLWSGLEGGGKPAEQEHQLKRAELAWLDGAADDLYYNGRAILDTVKLLPEDRPEKHQLLKTLDSAYLRIDWSRPGSESFYTSVGEAAQELADRLAGMRQVSEITVTAIGHTHIDVAWLWRLTHTREKAARSFSTVLQLMEQFPEYVFLQTQPQLYAYIKADYPEIYEKIKARVKEGRWEAGGAMWLEADCNLTSGESLVRQILYGTKFFREEFGADCRYLWLPDVFGYSWALPQILKKSGIDTFMTTKISWNQYNRMPHDTFKWRGIDGSEVLTHFVTAPETAEPKGWFYTYNGVIEPFSVKGIWEQYRDKSLNQQLLLSYGYGDGGGGVNREMLEMRRRMENMPGLPNVVTGRADEYFERLQQTVKTTDEYIHTWDGELYLEYHRGTYTSQAYNKRMNRKLELLYREAEWLQTLNAVERGSWEAYPQAKLLEGWQTILRNQFHDIIPGSSIGEVYEDSRVEYAEAELIGEEARTSAAESQTLDASASSAKAAVEIFNSASFVRTDTVTISLEPGMEEGVWQDAAGKLLQAQREDEAWKVRVEKLPALGKQTIWFTPQSVKQREEGAGPFNLRDSCLVTPYYVLEWNEAGQLTSIYDRDAEREVLAEGKCGNILQVFEDKPMAHDAWDIDIYYQEKVREIRDLQSVEMLVNGPLLSTVRFKWNYMNSVIVQDMTVYDTNRRIDFATFIDWQERQQLLKTAFPVAVRATEATYDIQFGNVKRPTHWNTGWDMARFESVGHQWVDLSERSYGVSLLNDCKYGHDIKDNVIRLSLLKSAIHPDPNADQGEHHFTYSLLPHNGDWVEARTAEEAWMLNNPLFSYFGSAANTGKSLFHTQAKGVAVDTVKKAEDGKGVIIRLHEYAGSRSQVEVSSDYLIKGWEECDLLERGQGGKQNSSTIAFRLNPYEIKTFIVDFAIQ